MIKLDDTDIEKQKFHQHKSPILIDNIGINKIVVYNKVPFRKKDFRYFIGYKDVKISQTFMHIPSIMSAFRRDFDKTKYIFFEKHEKLLEKYSKMQKKVSNIIKIRIWQ